MCDSITEYIENNKNDKSNIDIYNELSKTYNKEDIEFVFKIEYEIDIENILKEEYEIREKRFYQNKLRKQSLKFYNHKCIISDINRNTCLEIAHIKPVCKCEKLNEKMDVENTFVLWIDLHKYFDNYSFSINPNTSCIEVNKNCDDYDWLKIYDNQKLVLTDKNKLYLQYHYNVFKNI
jgi:predicted restriction endonuclease